MQALDAEGPSSAWLELPFHGACGTVRSASDGRDDVVIVFFHHNLAAAPDANGQAAFDGRSAPGQVGFGELNHDTADSIAESSQREIHMVSGLFGDLIGNGHTFGFDAQSHAMNCLSGVPTISVGLSLTILPDGCIDNKKVTIQ
jgi:hypothetical protein